MMIQGACGPTGLVEQCGMPPRSSLQKMYMSNAFVVSPAFVATLQHGALLSVEGA